MYARQRLNELYASSSVILATFIGLIANSWIVFGVATAILLALQLFGGAIRLGGGRPTTRRRKSFQRRGRFVAHG